MIKAFSILIVGFLLLLTIPICFGVGAGLIGLIFGLIGGLIGLVAGLIGAVFGGIAWIFKSIFHLFFGWGHSDFGSFHFNGFLVAALIITLLVVATRKK